MDYHLFQPAKQNIYLHIHIHYSVDLEVNL